MISRWWWLALLLILLPTPVASQSDSVTVQVVRVIDGDTIVRPFALRQLCYACTGKHHET